MSEKKPVTVLFSDEQLDELQQLASRKGISVGQALRQALDVNRLIQSAVSEGSTIIAKRGNSLQQLVLPR